MKDKPSTKWTDEIIARLRELHGEKLPASSIAAELNKEFRTSLTRNAVIGKCVRLKFGPIGGGAPWRKPEHKKRTPVVRLHRATKTSVPRILRARAPNVETPTTETTVETDQNIPLQQRRTLMRLTAKTCRWPVGNPGDAAFFFCGAPIVNDKPYCADHCARAYIKRESRSRFVLPNLEAKAA